MLSMLQKELSSIDLNNISAIKAIFGGVPEGILIVDAKGKFVFYNQAAEKLVLHGIDDCPKEEWVKRYNVYQEDLETPFPYDNLPLIRALRGVAVENQILALKNPTKLWGYSYISCSASPVIRNDEIVGAITTLRDVTQQKSDAQNLLKHKLALNGSFDGVIIFDKEGNVRQCNPRIEKMFGHSVIKLISSNIDFLVPRFLEVVGQAFTSKKSSAFFPEYLGMHVSQREIPLEISVSELQLDNTAIYIAVLKDLSERKQAEEIIKKSEIQIQNTLKALSSSNEELQKFAFICSHDLQEPLRMIACFSELLGKNIEESLSEEDKAYLKYILTGAQNAQTMVRDILDYTKVDAYDNDSQEEIDLNVIMDDIQVSLQLPIREKGAQLKIMTLPRVKSYKIHMYQLFQNLIANALKFIPEGREPVIEVKVEDFGYLWQFTVKDNGIGIKTENQRQIFDIFKRLHSKTEYAGTGIGLSICQKIVEKYGGKIWVESKFGEGSCFFFELPKMNPIP